MEKWNKLRVVIVGLARQGVALARFLLKRGARVILNDRQPPEAFVDLRRELENLDGERFNLEWALGGHPIDVLDGADLLCVSGGVPLSLPLVVEARARGIPVSNDSQIFMEAVPCPVVGITGSAGKTTTTTLVGRMAQAALSEKGAHKPYRKAWVGGNIGSPLISVIDEMQPEDLAILELSSFQLELMTVSPHIAAVLNITPNHLDRHGTMEAYKGAKARILNHQTREDIAVLGRDDPGAWSLAQNVNGKLSSFGKSTLPTDQAGVTYEKESLYLERGGDQPFSEKLMDRSDISLRGEHNLLNVMAACAIAAEAGFDRYAMFEGVKGFRGVPHRLEFVRSWGGADWYNDSIATAPERAMAAIRSFNEPLVVLAGGRDKDLPWEEFAKLVQQRVGHLVLFGEAANKILTAVKEVGGGHLIVTQCRGLREAVRAAADVLQPGDVVLLSPGGTSFDEFKDFEERGECFVQWVMELP
jgi:UDP-N-acetylmuramoylalanine--D-glutamate ligase